MAKIVAFGASNSKHSINKQFAHWAASQMEEATLNLLDLNDYNLPIYGIDHEVEHGVPQTAIDFRETLRAADGIIISFAEHNGSMATVFKNIYDWISRLDKPIWMDKPMLLMATSPGGRGGGSVLGHVLATFVHRGANIAGSFSLPFFSKNFDPAEGITEDELKAQFLVELEKFRQAAIASTSKE